MTEVVTSLVPPSNVDGLGTAVHVIIRPVVTHPDQGLGLGFRSQPPLLRHSTLPYLFWSDMLHDWTILLIVLEALLAAQGQSALGCRNTSVGHRELQVGSPNISLSMDTA